jgi:hypothetical protein
MIPIQYLAAACAGNSLFNIIPTWYEFLPSQLDSNGNCVPSIAHLADVWLIVLAIIDILLRVASLVAIFFIIYGGITYATSQGSPEATAKARSTILNAIIGLALSVASAGIVAFIAGQF